MCASGWFVYRGCTGMHGQQSIKMNMCSLCDKTKNLKFSDSETERGLNILLAL